MYGITEYLEACEYRKRFVSEQLDGLKQERQSFAADAERLEGVAEEMRLETVGYLLPEIQDDYLATLEDRLSYPGLLPIKREYDRRFQEAENRRVELAGMDEVQLHEYHFHQATEESKTSGRPTTQCAAVSISGRLVNRFTSFTNAAISRSTTGLPFSDDSWIGVMFPS